MQAFLLGLGLVLCAGILGRAAFDFGAAMPAAMGLAFACLVLAALVAGGVHLYARTGAGREHSPRARALLAAVIPLGFFAMSLGCSGLSFRGCSGSCSFVKLAWVPALAVVSALHFFRPRAGSLLALTAMCFPPLIPHCICYNALNASWIDLLGTSPVCYAWGSAVGFIAAGALHSGVAGRLSLVTCYAIVGGALSFFVGHHFFDFPW